MSRDWLRCFTKEVIAVPSSEAVILLVVLFDVLQKFSSVLLFCEVADGKLVL